MVYIKDKKILVTGGAGFLGSHVVDQLSKYSPKSIIVPRSKDYNLRNRLAVDKLLIDKKPDIIIHIAGKVGGIGETNAHPADFFFDNASMAINIIDSAFHNKVEKFIGIGSVCEYPKFSPIPFKEKDLWDGYPEETNAPYGLAKKMMLVQTEAYHKEYGFNGIHLLTVNLYGPRDNFDPKSSHVVPGMIRKFFDAKNKSLDTVIFWGDGSPTREFLFVEDCARAIILATEQYNDPAPINIGSGNEISIKILAEKIQKSVGYKGKIIWDVSKPNGQPRRCLDISLAIEKFGFRAKTNFDQGLKKTIDWYKKNMDI